MRRKRNKWNVSPRADRTWRGRTYASKAEMQYAQHLDFLVRTGSVTDVVEQPRFKLTKAEIVYVADFLVTEATGYRRVVDVKGAETPEFKIKKRLWAEYGPNMALEIVRKSGPAWRVSEVVMGPEENTQ